MWSGSLPVITNLISTPPLLLPTRTGNGQCQIKYDTWKHEEKKMQRDKISPDWVQGQLPQRASGWCCTGSKSLWYAEQPRPCSSGRSGQTGNIVIVINWKNNVIVIVIGWKDCYWNLLIWLLPVAVWSGEEPLSSSWQPCCNGCLGYVMIYHNISSISWAIDWDIGV